MKKMYLKSVTYGKRKVNITEWRQNGDRMALNGHRHVHVPSTHSIEW